MSDEVLVALITGLLTLIGVIITVTAGNRKTNETVRQSHELTLYRLSELEKKQDKHNSVIERTYKLEQDVAVLKEQINELHND